MFSVLRGFGRRPLFILSLCAGAIALAAPSSRAQVAPSSPAGALAAPTNLWVAQTEPAGQRGVLLDPTNVVAAETSPGVVTLTWSPVPGATAYALGKAVFPGESRQSSVLKAPAGTSLDDTDIAFCQSSAFGSTGWFVGKASWGICK